jgi:hypothetical protein
MVDDLQAPADRLFPRRQRWQDFLQAQSQQHALSVAVTRPLSWIFVRSGTGLADRLTPLMLETTFPQHADVVVRDEPHERGPATAPWIEPRFAAHRFSRSSWA